METKKVDVYVVMEADDVMGVYDNQDEAERMCNSYFEAVVEGPETLEITNHDMSTKDMIGVHVITEGDAVLGVYDDEEEAERMCNNYFEAEVSEAYSMELTQPENA